MPKKAFLYVYYESVTGGRTVVISDELTTQFNLRQILGGRIDDRDYLILQGNQVDKVQRRLDSEFHLLLYKPDLTEDGKILPCDGCS